MGAVLSIIPKSVSLRYGHMPEAYCGWNLPWINQNCKFHRSTLLLTLNCADNVPNIKFNGALGYKQAGCFDSALRWCLTRHRKQSFGFALFDNFLK